MDNKKIEGLKAYGFSDADIADLLATAAATEKSATDQGVAFKAAGEPRTAGLNAGNASGEFIDQPLPDIVVNGVTYKAMPPAPAEPAPDAESPMEEPGEEDDPNALTLSPGDMGAIDQMMDAKFQAFAAQIMGALDLEKKVAGHVQGLMAPYQQAQATKEAALTTQVAELASKVDDLTGAQPAAPYRASQAAGSAIKTEAELLAAVKAAKDGAQPGPWDDIIKGLGIGQPQ